MDVPLGYVVCEVCDAPTAQRCVACVAQGLSFSFCSRQHQRLLWRSHRLVCGTKSHPFIPPDLSLADTDTLRSLQLRGDSLNFPSIVLAPQKRRAKACWSAEFGPETKVKVKKGSKQARLLENKTDEVQQAILVQAYARLAALDDADSPILSPTLTPMHHTASLYMQIRSLHSKPIAPVINDCLLHNLLSLFQLASYETQPVAPPATYSPEYLSLAFRNVIDLLNPSAAAYEATAIVAAMVSLQSYLAPLAEFGWHFETDALDRHRMVWTREEPQQDEEQGGGPARVGAGAKAV